MGFTYADNYIDFQGVLTPDEIEDIIKIGKVSRIQTNKMPLDMGTLKTLNEKYFARFPYTEFRIYTYTDCDLYPLQFMDKVRKLSIESSSKIVNLEALYELKDLESLYIKAPVISDKDFLLRLTDSIENMGLDITAKSFNLENINRFNDLKILSLHKCKKNIELIEDLKKLQSLKLHGITLSSYSFINKLPNLKLISFSRGDTDDLSQLYGNKYIEGLYLFHLPKMESLEIIKELPNLKAAEIGQLTNVKEIPDLSNSMLEHLCLENMKNLLNFNGLQFAPHIKTVAETVCPAKIDVDIVLPVIKNTQLEQCAFYTTSEKKNKAICSLIEQYKKKCEANAHIVRKIIFPDGKM